jgi:hypothetical protein
MDYTPERLEQLRRRFVAERSSVRWVRDHQLVTVKNVATWRPQMIATPPTVTTLADARGA